MKEWFDLYLMAEESREREIRALYRKLSRCGWAMFLAGTCMALLVYEMDRQEKRLRKLETRVAGIEMAG